MSFRVSRVDYFYAKVADRPGEAYKILDTLAELGVNLLAFTAIPMGPAYTQLTLFPEDSHLLRSEAEKATLELDGPHPAFLVRGGDYLGVLAAVHERIFRAGVNVYASTGVTDGRGGFGYVIYVRPEEYEQAAAALEV
ncbi:MAG: hypothetical protein P8020_13860 [Acidobacteriota bacterium]|jgi:predicted amino acid-binding ACT domain protein